MQLIVNDFPSMLAMQFIILSRNFPILKFYTIDLLNLKYKPVLSSFGEDITILVRKFAEFLQLFVSKWIENILLLEI